METINNSYVEKQLTDHENRLRRLEESDVQQRIQLTNIEKSQSDIKLIITEQSKEQIKQSKDQQMMLNDFTIKMVDYFKDKDIEENKSENEIKFYNTKQFWAIISMIIGGIATYLGLK
ncbi:hypothetical protein [Clostridium sp. ZBS18]|uniref:hypothetical protein n=1 Tax=Clostridium sp. ZBS18 TaxID=2949967 RepID=UPI00207A78A7|nr:hypothetical protein [Clostridium sp. ZBS18]